MADVDGSSFPEPSSRYPAYPVAERASSKYFHQVCFVFLLCFSVCLFVNLFSLDMFFKFVLYVCLSLLFICLFVCLFVSLINWKMVLNLRWHEGKQKRLRVELSFKAFTFGQIYSYPIWISRLEQTWVN